MAHLFRLIVLLSLWGSGSAMALTAVSTNEYRSNNTGSFPWVTTYLAACQQRYSGYSQGRLVSQDATSANLECWQGSIWVAQNGFARRVIYSCPANSTLSGTTCTCNSGYVEQGGACVEPLDPAEEYCTQQSTNPAVGVSSPRPAGSAGLDSYTMCYSNQYSLYACSGTLEPDICGQGVDGKTHCTGKVTFAGSTPCTGTTQPQEPEDMPAPLPEAPPPGQCPGEVNGVTVYAPCSSTSSSNTKTNETTNSSGTTQTSETRNTTCNAAGSCTTTITTTTTVNGGSPSTSTSTTTQPKGDFCSENPGSSECGQQSSFAGACASGFVCQGDAVQCAMAKELHAQWCRDNQATDESALYDVSKGLEGDQTGDLPGNETIPFGPSSYDDSDAIGGAACVTDLTIEHEWLSATLPLSMICGPLLWFKNALLFIGGIAWLLIVFRRR